MPKINRLTRADFESIKAVRRVHGSFFTLSISSGGGALKCACVVSKKVALRANARNLIKRRFRAIIRSYMAEHAISPATLVITAKKQAKDATFDQIKKDITQLLRAVSR